MPRLTDSVPRYRKHEASGQAIVTIAGRDNYLGPWKSKASRIEYDRLVCEWITNGRPSHAVHAGSDLTVTELCAAYWRFARGYYREPGNSRPNGHLWCVKSALRFLRTGYGQTLAAKFGPLALAATQRHMVEADRARTYVNKLTDLIRRVFKWAASQELVPASVH
jgi:hypothetical protein